MKKFFIPIFLVILFLNFSCGKKEKIEKKVQEEIIKVQVMEIKPSYFEEIISSTGRIEADEEVKISSKIPGRVERIYCDKGDNVKRGTVLLKLDTKELLSQKMGAEALIKQTQATLENIKKNYERMKNLYNEGIVSLQSFEQTETQYEVTLAQLQSAKANLYYINTQIQNSKITSPISGVIAMKFIETGEIVGPGIPLFQIIDIRNVKIKVGIPEDKIKNVKRGSEVRLTTDAYPNRVFIGYINFISPSANPMNRLFDVESRIENKRGILKSGMFAKVEIITKKFRNIIVVPESAVLEDESGKFVFVYKDGIARKKIVETGIETKGKIEIKSGLKFGDIVITEGNYELEDRTKVKKEK